MQFREIRTTEEMKEDMMVAMDRGEYISGIFVEMVEEKMKRIAQTTHAVAVSSGTMGLKIALKAMGIGEGDIVIVPDITFIVCATVVMELGAVPIFVDVDEDTFLLDEKSTRNQIRIYGDQVKALMAVRLGGEPIPDWVYDCGVPVLIDSAHAIGNFDMRAVCAVYSFHPSKIVSGIEGGVIATNNPDIAIRAISLRCFGFDRGDRIAHEMGYKAYMSNLSSIIVYHNLKRLGATLLAREAIRDVLNEKLGLKRQGLGMYLVSVNEPGHITSKIPAIVHYPMTLSKMITGFAVNPKANILVDHLVSMPFHEWLSTGDIDMIVDIIKSN